MIEMGYTDVSSVEKAVVMGVSLVANFLKTKGAAFVGRCTSCLLHRNLGVKVLRGSFNTIGISVVLLRRLRKRGYRLRVVSKKYSGRARHEQFGAGLVSVTVYKCSEMVIRPSKVCSISRFFSKLERRPLSQ